MNTNYPGAEPQFHMPWPPKSNKPKGPEPEWKKRRRAARVEAFEQTAMFSFKLVFYTLTITGGLLTGHWMGALGVALVSACLMAPVVGALFAMAAHIAETEK